MAYDDDYEPVAADDDEEERRKREGDYPVPTPAAAPNTPAAALASAAPPAPLKVKSNPSPDNYPAPEAATPKSDIAALTMGSPTMPTLEPAPTAPAPATPSGGGDLVSQLATEPADAEAKHRPQWKGEYEPAEKHGWGKFGSIMASLNPLSNEIVNERPLRNAERNYKNATAEYEAPIGEELKESETAKNTAQAAKDRADAAGAGKNPDQQAFNELRKQVNPETGKPFTAVEARGKLEAQKSENTPKAVPATPADLATLSQAVQGSSYLTPEQKAAAAFPEGYTPTKEELKTRLDAVHGMETNARQGKQDEFNNSLKKIAAQNSELLAQAHLADEAEKRKQAQAKDVMTADSGYGTLYAQENYHDAVADWHKSGSFAKDSGIVDSIVNQAHGGSGLASIGGGATIGALIGGPAGAVAGAIAPALGNAIMPMAQGYLDAAKRAGISDQGYKAMQAYFNALPGRMAYEIQIQGISPSVMRSQEMISKVLQTLPPPNTPDDKFENAFQQYYTPMKTMTEKKVKLIAPPDYQPPSKESFYPKESNAGGGSGAEGTPVYQKGVLIGHTKDGKNYIPLAKP